MRDLTRIQWARMLPLHGARHVSTSHIMQSIAMNTVQCYLQRNPCSTRARNCKLNAPGHGSVGLAASVAEHDDGRG